MNQNHRRSCSIAINEIPVRRNSYQMAINTSKNDHIQKNLHSNMFSSASSSICSFHPHTTNTTRSMYTVHDLPSQYHDTDQLHRSLSQPAVRSADNDLLLENATYLLDSPVHALRPAHCKSRTTLAPTNPVSNRSSLGGADSLVDSNYCSSVSSTPITSIYRIVLIRSLASALALSSVLSTEVLQTSIYSVEHGFQSLLTFHLSASMGAFLLAIYASRIHHTRHRWTISDVLAYDRCSQILIVLATMLTGTWVALQYFQNHKHLLLISAAISGFSTSCMILKTFEHFLQLSASLPIPNVNKLKYRLNIFASIYNSFSHLALTIGGTCLLGIVLFQQYRREYVLVGSQSCCFVPCFQRQEQDGDQTTTASVRAHNRSPELVCINMTMHTNDKKQEWQTEPTRYIFFVTLLIMTIISLLPQAGIDWTTSILSMSRRLSMLYYSNDENKTQTISSSSIKRFIRFRNYALALFVGFQEGYIFGSLFKFDVTCIFGLRHTIEILILYGLGATLASVLLTMAIKRMSLLASSALTSLFHLSLMLFLHVCRSSPSLFAISTLVQKYILFSLLGFGVGLWSTIAMHYLCNSSQFSSSSIFAQSFAIRCLGRLISYMCTVLVCQSLILYFNSIFHLVLVAILSLSYFCCQQSKT